ncbi:MAG: hypothetical protein ACKVPX_05440 [Myxococcaceae bacterium]
MRFLVSAALLLPLACIVPAPGGQGGKSQMSAPPLVLGNGAVFGDRVEVVRAVVRPGRATVGEAVTIALIMRVLAPFDDDYDIFVHIEDADGRAERRNSDHAPLRGTRPTRSWRAGETLTDEFVLDVPNGVQRAVSVWFGFWQPRRDVRVPLSNPERVRHDGQDRVWLGQIPVGR